MEIYALFGLIKNTDTGDTLKVENVILFFSHEKDD